jgi:hypothetical protein
MSTWGRKCDASPAALKFGFTAADDDGDIAAQDVRFGGEADIARTRCDSAIDPRRTLALLYQMRSPRAQAGGTRSTSRSA